MSGVDWVADGVLVSGGGGVSLGVGTLWTSAMAGTGIGSMLGRVGRRRGLLSFSSMTGTALVKNMADTNIPSLPILNCSLCEFTVEDENKLMSHVNYIHGTTGTNQTNPCETTVKELNNLEKVSWEEQRIDDQQMDIEGDTKESSQEAQMYEEQILDDRSRFRDEKVKMKEKQMEEEEIKYQEKKKIESESAKKVERKKSQKKRKKKSIKGKQAQPTSKQLLPKFQMFQKM